MQSSAARALAHAWITLVLSLCVAAGMLLMRIVQVYEEMGVANPARPGADRVREALSTAVGRRADDPSLWALLCAAFAAFLLTRAIYYASQSLSFPPHLWTRSRAAWLRVIGFMSLSVGTYLVVVYLKQETFWYARKADHASLASTLIPSIQWLEGAMNIIVIVIACSLVGPAYMIGQLLNNRASSSHLAPNESKAAARLATLGVSPIILMIVALAVFGSLRYFFNVGPIDTSEDILTGAGAALLICVPTLAVTWRFWLFPKKWGIALGTISILGVAILALLTICRCDSVSAPRWLLERSYMPAWLWVPAATFEAVSILGGVCVLWFYACG